MRRHQLTVADRVFLLASSEEAQRVETAMEQAVRSGGAFVPLELVGSRAVRVLVSPGVVAYLEIVEIPEDQPAGDGAEFTSLHDWDFLA